MPGKIDVTGIIKAHLQTLGNPSSGRRRPLDYAALYLLPAVAAAALVLRGVEAAPPLASAMATALPLAALLLSTTLHIVLKAARPTAAVEARFARQLVSSIVYGMLACITGTAAAAAALVAPPGAAKHVSDFALYFLSAHVCLTALTILSRLRALVAKRPEE